MKKIVIIALLASMLLVGLSGAAMWDLKDMFLGNSMLPAEGNGAPWLADDSKLYFGTGQDAYLSYDPTGDKIYLNDTDLYVEEDATFHGSIAIDGSSISNGKVSNPMWVDDPFYVTGISYLNRTKATQLESSTRADLNRTRATQLDVSGLAALNRTQVTQLVVSARSSQNRTEVTQLSASLRTDLNRTRITQLDVSGLTGLNATIAARPIAQPVSAELSANTVYAATDDKYMILVDASGANVTVTLPVATSNTGRSYVVVATKDPGNFYVRVTATSGSLIRPRGVNAGSTYLVSTDTSPEVTLTSDGTRYWARTTGTWAQHAA